MGIWCISVVIGVDGLVVVSLGCEAVWTGRVVNGIMRTVTALGTVVVTRHVC